VIILVGPCLADHGLFPYKVAQKSKTLPIYQNIILSRIKACP